MLDKQELEYIFYEKAGKYLECCNNQEEADERARKEILEEYNICVDIKI